MSPRLIPCIEIGLSAEKLDEFGRKNGRGELKDAYAELHKILIISKSYKATISV
jgi:hypothetical protein